MIRATVIEFINEEQPRGIFDDTTETRVTVKAEIRSVTRREFYEAAGAGITPELVFRIANFRDYSGQKVFWHESQRWRVIRTYTNGQTLEITAGRATNDA